MQAKLRSYLVYLLAGALLGLAAVPACTRNPATAGEASTRLKVVATTNLVGDVVHSVAGDLIELTVLMPVGVDPHSFEPVPQDVAAVAAADLVFLNGLGVETSLEDIIVNAGGDARVVSVSEGIPPLYLVHEDNESNHADEGEFDPHVWFDPLNVVVWTKNIAAALAEADPANAGAYQAGAKVYEGELVALDRWVQEQVARLPPEKRLIVSDHDAFGYFARRYGFTLSGTLVPGFSTLAEPSAQELAALEAGIKTMDVAAIFVGNTVNPGLAERVSQDTGIPLVYLYTGSLSASEGPAADYLAYMRHNVMTIVEALSAGGTE